MAFITEHASEDDIKKFKLDGLLNGYLNTTASYQHNWVVDKDTSCWLLPVKKLNSSESLWILHYKHTNIEIELFKTKKGDYDLISIAPNSLDNVDIISTLRDALSTLDNSKIVWQSPKKAKPIKVKQTEEKTDNKKYIAVLFSIILFSSFVFFIQYQSTKNKAHTNNTKQEKKTTKQKNTTDKLVFIDMNKDASISTIKLKKSASYFDLTGDGMRTKTEWVQPIDAILVYDKNNNNKIDNINELIKNKNITNNDLHLKLKIWQDNNQDGKSQSNELVKFDTKYLPHIMTKRLKFDPAISYKDISTIKNYKRYPISKTLPFLRGYGVVPDSTVVYNTDDDFRNLAIDFASNMKKTENQFEKFIDAWSGYTRMQRDLQKKYNLNKPPKLANLDKKVWVCEHFIGKKTFTESIEASLELTAINMISGGSDTTIKGSYNEAVVHDLYDDWTNRNKAFFSLDAFYSDILNGNAVHKRGIDEYVFTNRDLFHLRVSEYMNNKSNSLEKKLYLAKQMKVLKKKFLDYNSNTILSKINDIKIRNLIKHEL